MVFSSAIFLFVFLPLVFLLTRLTKRSIRLQNLLLALASLVFYAFGQLQYVPLFLASVLINYLSGVLLTGRFARSKAVLAVSVVLNLGILGVFKYTDFILHNLNAALGTASPMTAILLPIGLSFFTFQGLSYVIDVYREPESGTRDYLKLLLYLSFFPQLIAGPIVKYHDISAQIDSRVLTPEESAAGIRRFIRGLAKKLLIADSVGYLADAAYATLSGTPDSRVMWLGAVCYTLQIYYDFSGYSDMAIGMGHMFGFTIRENFLFPYGASSLRDFWRRWHVSLSTWFREYLYIPLGGNRRGRARAALNRFAVFLCTGIWHGANWTFLVWGAMHGLCLIAERPLRSIHLFDRVENRAGRAVIRLLNIVKTFAVVTVLWSIFRAPSFGALRNLYSALYHNIHLPCSLNVSALPIVAIAVVILVDILIRQSRFDDWCSRRHAVIRWGIYAALIFAIAALSSVEQVPFIYFQF